MWAFILGFLTVGVIILAAVAVIGLAWVILRFLLMIILSLFGCDSFEI